MHVSKAMRVPVGPTATNITRLDEVERITELTSLRIPESLKFRDQQFVHSSICPFGNPPRTILWAMRYHRLGELPRKHHIAFRKPDGGLYAEQLYSTEGFSGPMSTLYHINLPTEVTSWEDAGSVKPVFIEEGPLHPRHLKTMRAPAQGDAVTGRKCLMGN